MDNTVTQKAKRPRNPYRNEMDALYAQFYKAVETFRLRPTEANQKKLKDIQATVEETEDAYREARRGRLQKVQNETL